jgi:hypothetical protein
MEEGSLPYTKAAFMVVDRVAHAPVWISEMTSEDALRVLAWVGLAQEATGILLVLYELPTADPRRMWRELAEFR